MKTIRFANGEEICALGQRTWNLGVNSLSRKEEATALLEGIELGMTMIDTAEMYANEEFVGQTVKEIRDRVFHVSKVYPDNADYRSTIHSCENSLKKLQTDCIDLYLLHWKSRYPLEETVKALTELQQSGKISMWGVSNLDLPDMELIESLPNGNTCAANQVLYNLGERGIEYDLVPWSQKERMPIIAYTPMGQRLMRNNVVYEIAEKHHSTHTQILLAWTIRQNGVMAIPQASSIAHVREDFAALNISLDIEDLRCIDQIFPLPTHSIPLAGW